MDMWRLVNFFLWHWTCEWEVLKEINSPKSWKLLISLWNIKFAPLQISISSTRNYLNFFVKLLLCYIKKICNAIFFNKKKTSQQDEIPFLSEIKKDIFLAFEGSLENVILKIERGISDKFTIIIKRSGGCFLRKSFASIFSYLLNIKIKIIAKDHKIC